MKKLLSLVFVSAIAGALLLSSQTKGNAQQHPRPQHATVLFSTGEATDGSVMIYTFSAFGPGVPEFTYDAAEYITKLRDSGFTMEPSPWGYMFSR